MLTLKISCNHNFCCGTQTLRIMRVVKDILGKCITCGLPYTTTYWNDGSSTCKEPRVIHSIDNIVYLVSAVYVCSNKHRLLAHDPRVQQCFPTKSVIPFVLFHKTWFYACFCRDVFTFSEKWNEFLCNRESSYGEKNTCKGSFSLQFVLTNHTLSRTL